MIDVESGQDLTHQDSGDPAKNRSPLGALIRIIDPNSTL